jgi:CheY-like chemotaxis protein
MAEEKKDPEEPAAPAAESRKWRVLVVDDCERTTRLIQSELDARNFEVLVATSVDEATKLLLKRETRPDFILLDVIMPGINGEQFCRFVKGNEMFAKIKVVLCSAMEQKELEATAQKCGADGFVHKEAVLGRKLLDQLRRDMPPKKKR